MGLHQRHTHGRVFRGLDARAQLEMRKRDSHGDHIKMNVPDGMERKEAVDANANVATAYTVQYVTVAPTFEVTGPVIYSTVTDESELPTAVAESLAQTTEAAAAAATTGNADEEAYASAKSAAQNHGASSTAAATTSQNSDEADYAARKSAAQNRGSTATAASTTVASTTQTVKPIATTEDASSASPMTTLTTSSAPTTTFEGSNGNVVGGVGGAVQATHTSSSDSAQISKDGDGMSGGAKAGLAIGIIALLALVGAGLFFLIRRRKSKANQDHQEITNEKRNSFLVGGNGQLAAAPQTNRFSSTSDSAPSFRSTATAPRLSLRPVTQFLPAFGGAADASNEKPASAWERRSPQNENPFGDAAVLSEKQAQPTAPASNPFDERPTTANSTSHSAKGSWESSQTASVATAAAVPVAAGAGARAGPPPGSQPNNVHRVQLDFKPTMDDELGLKSGEIVRMLHEYDDGWALCVRMDRSQQGVVPRTCLSKLPVKPRPRPDQGSHQMPLPSPASRQQQPQSPAGPPSMYPRPLTPNTGSRPQSPAPGSGGVVARKPVPGMAM